MRAAPFNIDVLRLTRLPYAGPPVDGTYDIGDWVADLNGTPFRCVVAGTPGTWIQSDVNFSSNDFSERAGAHSSYRYAYRSGRLRSDNVVTDVPDGTVAVMDGVNYVEVAGDGSVWANAVGFSAGRLPLAIVHVTAGVVDSVVDKRAWLEVSTIAGEKRNAYNEVPTGVLDGVNTIFTTASKFESGTTRVCVGGYKQTIGVDYLEVGDQTIGFTEAPVPGDDIDVSYRKL